MQAIHTVFVPLTDKHPYNRIKARCNAGTIMVDWDDEASIENNHANAARALAIKLGWTKKTHGAMRGGALPGDNGYCFVFDDNGGPGGLYCFAPDEVK